MVKRMRSFFAVVMLVIAATVNAQVYRKRIYSFMVNHIHPAG